MKYIANILTDDKTEINELYNVVSVKESLVRGIPTLIIGWDKAKEMFPEASIIEWKINEDFFWTYGKYERREKYEEALKRFDELSTKRLIENVRYVFYDVLLYDETKFFSFLKLIENPTVDKVVYAANNMLYVFLGGDSLVVYGISLRDCDYINITYKKRLFSTVHSNPNIKLLSGEGKVSRNIRYKMKNREYIVPYLYS